MKQFIFAMAALATIIDPAHASCGSGGVFLFKAYWCPVCRVVEQFFASYGVTYRQIEVTDNAPAQEFMREHFGSTAIPVVVVDGNVNVGYNAEWLKDALCIR
jgi:glutaredoxin